MKIFVAADIYGTTPELQALVGQCCAEARILSPWDGAGCPYQCEAEAHAAFLSGGGVAAYAARLDRAIANQPAFIVGFSAGATAAWLYAAQPQVHPDSRGVLFYGSRIRYFRKLTPRFPLQLVFAAREAAFDPATLAAELSRPNVQTEIVPATDHGFMNPHSPAYSAPEFLRYRKRLQLEVERLRQNQRAHAEGDRL
jgi:dienelactone hydrolase